MSNEAMTWCAKLHPGRGPKGVLMCLADRGTDHAGEDWTCYPSVAFIMQWTDYSRPAVERNLKLLWREGYISRQRRRLANGRLGIYDYTLHRDEERRAALKAARADVQDIDAAMETGCPADPEPPIILTPGPCVVLTDAIRHFEPQPCVKMMGQEPLEEPLLEPSPGARERLVAEFGQLEAALPRRVLKFTDRGKAFAAFCDAAALGVTVERLVACARRMAADPDFRSRKFPPPLEDWIAKGQWRGWDGDDGAVAAGLAGAADGDPVPDEIRAAFLGVADAGKVGSYLTPCRYEPGPPARLVARTGIARDWLRGQAAVLQKFGLVVDVQERS